MQNDNVLKSQGMKILAEYLGVVEAERFITLVKRESFDYTEWQRELYQDVPLKTFLQNAADFRCKQNTQPKIQ